jgi:hypothetical protein
MSRLIRVGRLGQVYVEWDKEDSKAPLDVWKEGGELLFRWKRLHVIASRPECGAAWGIV